MICIYKVYQIEYGDTIDTIASKTGSSIDEIKRLNGIMYDSDLKLGNLIVVPKVTDDNFVKYIVQKGDTIYSISNKYGVNPNMLLTLNGLNKDDYIYPNQEIIVPNKDVDIYITKEGDSIDNILDKMEMSLFDLVKENNKIFVYPDQLIVNKKEKNN